MNQRYASTRKSNITPKRLLLILALIVGCLPVAKAQDLYIIHNGDNYLSHNASTGAVNTTRVTTFDPTTCFWIISGNYLRPVNSSGEVLGSLYLRPRSGNNTYSLNTNTSTYYATWNGLSDGGQPYYSRYLRLNGTTWEVTNTNSNRGTLRLVTVSTVSNTATPPTISGADVLTTTGNSSYTASGAAYQQGGYTNYRFNNADHFFNGNTAITPAAATIGSYTWSLSDNTYASVNSTSGVVTVNSLPESDITLTLTATTTATGGTPAAPANTTLTASKEITIQGTTPSAPTISVSGTTVTMSTTAAGTTSIRYTLDGTTPTATSGTVYNGAIDLSSSTNSPVTIKAVTVRNNTASSVAEQTVTLTLPEPVITVNASAGTATISATSGATIYYTTNGSDPTTSSSTYSGSLSGLSLMTTIKAIAVKDGWNDSPIASETIRIPSGVSGGVVTLFDYEDHNWSYYSDPDCPIHSLNPADVKITYNGNGTGTVQTNNSDTPSTWGANATTVKVGIDADASTFIYYETLERTDGRTAASAAAATGRCAYTTIANPFSVRPTYSSDATSVYRGFYAWRVKSLSGGTIHSAATGGTSYGVGSTINAETEIYFAPSSEYGMEVEFEALWARAYVSTSAAPSNNLGVERNFYVITASATSNITAGSYPCTYTSIYPNGTTNGTTAATSVTVYKYGGFTASADSKIEYIILRNNSSTVNANGKNFTIGRGVSGYNGGLCATNLYGLNASSTTSFRFNFASGSFTNLYFCGDGNSMSSGVLTSVIGCDYDRAMGDNDNLEITDDIIAGHNGTGGSNNNEGADFLRCTVKSGDFDLGDYGGGVQFYLSLWGNSGSGTYGKKTMVVEGGIFSDISGGIDVQDDQVSAADMVEIRVKGGTVNGALYGAAQYAAAYGNRYIIITGGTMKGWVAGGANGTQTTGGKLTGDTYVYFGGRARCDSEGSNTTMGSGNATGGNIFGAGSGNSGAASTATVGEVNNSTVVIADECYVERNVYGGGNYGSVSTGTGHKSDIYIKGGTIDGSVFGGSNNQKGQIVNINMTDGQVNTGIYGGSNTEGTVAGPVALQIDGGTVGDGTDGDGIFGGGYGNATVVSGNVTMTLGASTTATDWVKVYGNVYGGSALGTVSGNATITMNKGEINGNLFGGALGNNTYAAQVTGNVAVTVNSGKVTGAVFGCNDANGTPKGTVTVTINGSDASQGTGNSKVYALQGVYGGGNLAHYNPTTATNGYPKVIVNGCTTSIKDVYGGGNAAAVPQTDVTINGGDIDRVFAGGNGESGTPANVGYQNKIEPTTTNSYGNGTATAKIYGGTIHQVFGGSNAHGVIREGSTITVDKSQGTGTCPMMIAEVYGGGNEAAGNAATLTIGCTGTIVTGDNGHAAHPENIGTTLEGIGTVYGGANKAAVNNNIAVTINSGIVGNVFGGNNQTGTISGTIDVTIEKTNDACGWYVGNVFGGGNLAQYTSPNDGNGNPTYPHVNILNGAVSGNVYGGGKGDPNDHSKGQVTGAPVVTIGDNTSAHAAYVASVGGDVYGGGDAGNVVGTPVVNVVNKCTTTISGDVYGGGNAADVNGTDVNIDGGIITGMVFGGGHGDKNSNPQKEANVNGNVAVDVTGGTINKVFGGSNSKGAISGTVAVNIEKGANSCDMHITEVYGGGNEADGNAGTITIKCTGDYENNGEGITTVYGGANAADVGNNINLTIKGGHIDNVYGGNNTSGSISGSVTVNVNWDDALTCGKYLGNVFGGGNLAALSGAATVNIQKGTVSHNVYGGGNKAGVGSATVSMTGGNVLEGLYGGCNTSGTVSGDIIISLTGGQMGTDATHRADVFGGGLGSATATSGSISVTLGDGTTSTIVYGDIYGGSALGSVNSASANPANTTTLTINGSTLHGTIYGGGKGDVASLGNGHSDVTAVSNGDVVINYTTTNAGLTGLYGGANINGNVKGDITVNVLANVGASGTNINVFGGGLGVATQTEGDVTVKFGTENLSIAPVIYGNIYGGSSQGQVGSTQGQSGATNNNTTVYIYNGTVRGNVYGGGLGVKNATGNYDAGTYVVATDSIEAVVNGNALVYIGTAAQTSGNNVVITGNVFGGSDRCGNTLGDIEVHIYHTDHDADNTVPNQSIPSDPTFIASVDDLEALDSNPENYALQGVFGGGNLAHYWSTGSTSKKKALVYVHGCENSIQYLYGGGNAANTTADSIVIEGGRFDKIFGGGNGEVAALPAANVTNGNAATYIYGGLFNYIFGGSNTKGSIEGDMDLNIDPNEGDCGRMVVVNLFGGGNLAPCSGGELTVKCGDLVVGDVYGGANMATITGDVTLTIEGGTLSNVFGGSKGVADDPDTNEDESVAANIDGNVTLNLKGGTMINAFGGSDQKGNITGKITVNVLENSTCPLVVTNVYGGGNVTAYTPDDATSASPEVNIKHLKPGNSISGDVFGGGYGQTAIVSANPVVTIGDDIATDTATVSGNVYGGGSLAAVTGNTSVLVKNANTNVAGNVFGGGSQAGVSGTSTVQVANGTVGTGVYGGCNTSGSVGGTAEVIVTGGAIGSSGQHANVYGGGLGPDTRMNGDVLVTIGATDSNTPPTYSGSAVITGDVYGGSAKGKTNCNDEGNAHQGTSKTDVTLYGGTIDGDLYGGGHGIDNAAANVYGPVQVTVNKGTVTGSVYGCNNAAGAPQSTVNVDVYGTDTPSSGYALGHVFGGGNEADYPNTPVVKVHNCSNSIEYVYGGGNAATVASTDVTIYGGNVIDNVFGGCYGAAVTTGGTNVKIYGGTINHVYGGNNQSGTITGDINVTVEKTQETDHPSCEMHIGEVYGGGNVAASNAGNISIGCTGTGGTEGIQYVYGGANRADVTGPIELTIQEGRIANVFGGNNNSGTITGAITVNINKKDSPCVWDITNVFGGGNQAIYGSTTTPAGDYPEVNILNGLVSGDVFGGGLGLLGDLTKGVVTGNPQVTVNGSGASVNGGVYGGGSLAPTVGNPLVTLTTGALTNVYGGGKAASITGAPTVNINGGTVSTGVYGGCDSQGNVSGDITVNVMSGVIGTQANLNNNILANVFGGGYGPATTTSGNIEVNIDSLATFVAPVIYGDVYGGSALGDVNDAATDNTVVNVLYGTLKTHEVTSGGFPVYHGGNVFGGGLGDGSNAAKVKGTVTVNIGRPYSRSFGDLNPEDDNNVGNAVIEGNVYGCNNTNGSPQDSVTVHIYRTHRGATDEITYDDDDATYALHNVFGGGNEADYIPATGASNKKLKVWIHDCYNSIERVFGGSNAAAAGAAGNEVTVHTNIDGGRFNNVFGGGNGEVSAADIHGDVKLEIHGGLVDEFYVGSNQRGTIYGSSTVTVDEISNCQEVLITEFFCGGKYANVVGNIEATIDCADALTVTNLYGGCKEADVVAGNGQPGNVHLSVYGGHYTNVFGGSKGVIPPDGANAEQLAAASADIDGNVVLDLYGGTIENVYGGSNINGNIKGTITVNVIDKEDPDCPLYITNIYGGSNETDYTPTYTITPGTERITPVVNVVHINSGIQGNIYGGSRGLSEAEEPTKVVACPQVNIGYDASMTGLPPTATYDPADYSQKAVVSGNVFGGGDAATVNGSTEVFLRNRAKVFGNVYGGGNKAEVTGNTKVIVNGQNN